MPTRHWHHSDTARVARSVGMRIMAPTLIFTAALSACADRSPDNRGDVSELRLVALPRIDGGGSPGQAGFGSIADLVLGEDGSVFVLDAMNRTIHVFDDRGTRLRTFGGQGEGPGELEQPVALRWGPDGHLWVVDAGNSRYTVFDTSGGLVATYRSADPFVFRPRAVGFSSERLLYSVFLEFGRLNEPTSVVVEGEIGDDQVRERRRAELPFVEQPPVFEHRGEGTVLMQPIPFSSAPVLRIGRDGALWYAETGEPWVQRRSLAGGVEQTFGRDFDPPRVTPEELQERLGGDEGIEELRTVAGPDNFAEFTSRIPDTKPHLQGFFLDDEENVWIIRSRQAGSGDDALPMDVYDPSGTLVAVARAALEPEPTPRVRNGLLAGVVTDELGVESIARYRIER